MRFSVTQTIAAPADAVARAYASRELYDALEASERLGRPEVLERLERGGLVTLRIRYRFIGDLAPAVTAVVDRDRLTWVEESVHDVAALTVGVTLHPDHYPDRLRCTGTYGYVARGDRTERQVEGDLRVRALLVAGQVERAIVSGLTEHLAAEALQVERHLTA